MTPQDTYIMSRYTAITEAKHRDVRRMQAEMTRSALRGLITAAVKRLRHAPNSGEVQSLKKA